MKQTLQPSPENQPNLLPQIIKSSLPVIGLCLVLGGGGLVAVFSQKPPTEKVVEKIIKPVEEKVEQEQPQLPPYTLFVEGEKVTLKFHSTDSNMEFSNLSDKQTICLVNGGGIGCVLPGYQPKLEVMEAETTPTAQTEIKQQSLKIPDIEISRDMIDNIVFIGGVGLGLLLLSKFKKQ